ncbi:MAG: hypothetical protein IJD57_02255 [Candidatus Gastranaerophilales bacterium]|nr:hypothetical protein [Candidatus Gastranaerophilales bacterium]
MKKLILLFVFLSLVFAPIQAQETFQLTGQEEIGQMPTDEEIMQIIQKYNFDANQQEYLFKETKRKLQEIYQLAGEQAVQTQKEEVKKTTAPKVKYSKTKTSTSSMKRKKKYTSHPPLTRRGVQKAN